MTPLDIAFVVACCTVSVTFYSVVLAVLIAFVDRARTRNALEYESKVGAIDATLRAMTRTYTAGGNVHGNN